jgi:hypothetical protein
MQSTLQILRTNQKRFGFFFARFNQANGGVRRQGGEEVFFRPQGIEFDLTVEFQHALRILRPG